MKKLIILLFIISISLSVNAQWHYNSGGNDFDGKYRTSYVMGKGFEFPYTTPRFIVNNFYKGNEDNVNIYVTEIGYLGCGNRDAKIIFNSDGIIYRAITTINSGKDVLFIHSLINENGESLNTLSFLQKLMNSNYFSIRVSSNCGKSDFKFSLSGSSKAISFVVKNIQEKAKNESLEKNIELKKAEEKRSEEEELKRSEEEELKRKLDETTIELFGEKSIQIKGYFNFIGIYLNSKMLVKIDGESNRVYDEEITISHNTDLGGGKRDIVILNKKHTKLKIVVYVEKERIVKEISF